MGRYYRWETTFERFEGKGKGEESLTVRFSSAHERIPLEGKQLENFVGKAWQALLDEPRSEARPGWSSWLGGRAFHRVTNHTTELQNRENQK